MSRHSFDPDIAKKVGLNAAVIYQNIIWWCERNAVKGRNIHDGNAWTFNSISSFERLFDYLTAKQIRTALDKLEETGLLDVGNFNKDARDRTKWYAVAQDCEAFARLVSPHLPKRAETFAPEGEPLPDSKPDSKHTPKPPEGADLFSAESKTDDLGDTVGELFSEWWEEIWPSHFRKKQRADCEKLYRKIVSGKLAKVDKIGPRELNEATRRYIASVDDRQFLKGPLPWLRAEGWTPFVGQSGGERRNPLLQPMFGEVVR